MLEHLLLSRRSLSKWDFDDPEPLGEEPVSSLWSSRELRSIPKMVHTEHSSSVFSIRDSRSCETISGLWPWGGLTSSRESGSSSEMCTQNKVSRWVSKSELMQSVAGDKNLLEELDVLDVDQKAHVEELLLAAQVQLLEGQVVD
ncbi:hypothetical protein OJ253_3698 [Cryptosporidium canis]|uniref:Uncharacterized protein n=1 Tax=Cryptosporidium canis TaxID=195482 RepID=A0A9D5DDU9_9CRYT|nr:hypothetical protein OJ253_3698 [Cryptosporidium canis]